MFRTRRQTTRILWIVIGCLWLVVTCAVLGFRAWQVYDFADGLDARFSRLSRLAGQQSWSPCVNRVLPPAHAPRSTPADNPPASGAAFASMRFFSTCASHTKTSLFQKIGRTCILTWV
jgi:hypothetical protein